MSNFDKHALRSFVILRQVFQLTINNRLLLYTIFDVKPTNLATIFTKIFIFNEK